MLKRQSIRAFIECLLLLLLISVSLTVSSQFKSSSTHVAYDDNAGFYGIPVLTSDTTSTQPQHADTQATENRFWGIPAFKF